MKENRIVFEIIQGGLRYQPSLQKTNVLTMLPSDSVSGGIENINDFGFTHTRAKHTSHHLLNLRIGYPLKFGNFNCG